MERSWDEEFGIDDSFKKPGSIPFKWEIQPGIPKPHGPTPGSSPLKSKLSPPPSKFSHTSMRATNHYARSVSASPSKRRSHLQAPRPYITSASAQVVVSMQSCLPVPSLRRRDDKKSTGTRGTFMLSPLPSASARSSPSFSSTRSSSSFSSTRSSPSFSSPFRRTMHARDEMELAAPWLF